MFRRLVCSLAPFRLDGTWFYEKAPLVPPSCAGGRLMLTSTFTLQCTRECSSIRLRLEVMGSIFFYLSARRRKQWASLFTPSNASRCRSHNGGLCLSAPFNPICLPCKSESPTDPAFVSLARGKLDIGAPLYVPHRNLHRRGATGRQGFMVTEVVRRGARNKL